MYLDRKNILLILKTGNIYNRLCYVYDVMKDREDNKD